MCHTLYNFRLYLVTLYNFRLHLVTLYNFILHLVTLYNFILHLVTLYNFRLHLVTLYNFRLHLVTLYNFRLHLVTLYNFRLHLVTLYNFRLHLVTLYNFILHLVTLYNFILHLVTLYNFRLCGSGFSSAADSLRWDGPGGFGPGGDGPHSGLRAVRRRQVNVLQFTDRDVLFSRMSAGPQTSQWLPLSVWAVTCRLPELQTETQVQGPLMPRGPWCLGAPDASVNSLLLLLLLIHWNHLRGTKTWFQIESMTCSLWCFTQSVLSSLCVVFQVPGGFHVWQQRQAEGRRSISLQPQVPEVSVYRV